ncbi:ATP-dependent nuclease [Synoicihabitans lomoniglobus]|uniref:AAA family ATPase n=1 Tax=Synoicihabitans lomoniglobus TaxID=2909285 RepID=A0AAF0I3L1_9BACT|nr:ATP-binding protein [Opitutaceae bacterium LMO-M01]WED66209.1 AAA family ATPase [Opitutaceae bacterium LMO-M01]
MRISKITVENFRSIRRVEIDASAFNVLVGRNNHGKTNLFDAIQWFYTGSGDLAELKNSAAREDDEISVELEFSGVQEGLGQITHADNQTKLRNVLGESDTMRVKRMGSKPKERLIYNPTKDEWKKQPCGTDGPFNNCIPRFEFVEATKNLRDVGNYKSTTPIGKMLGGVLAEILEAEEEYVKFREQFEKLFSSETSSIKQKLKDVSGQVCEHLKKQFPDCADVEFLVQEPAFDELLKNFRTEVDDGVTTTAEEKGDGMQRALMLAIIKTYADQRRDDALGRSFIFFIDEAELHLHPTAQRQLKQALLELADGHDQVFINTHSSVLLTDNYGQQSLFRVAKEAQGETQIGKIDSSPKKHEVIFELLGGSPADILLPANFLIVEGPSEVEFFKHVISRHYSHQVEIHVLAANGDDERQRQQVTAVEDLLATIDRRPIYREKLTILFDKPDTGKEQRFEDFKNGRLHANANDQLFVLPVHGLEDYYPAALRAATQLAHKVKLAEYMGRNITKENFENHMPIMFRALEHCWANAY